MPGPLVKKSENVNEVPPLLESEQGEKIPLASKIQPKDLPKLPEKKTPDWLKD
jgi:hypothetical protein